jgi:small-conductance mechanosensitive channel
MNFLEQTMFHLAGQAVSGTQLMWAVVVLLAGMATAFVAASYLGRRLLWPGSAGGNTVPIILRGMRAKIVFFSLLGSLAVLGVNVMPLIWILMAVGAIAALAWRSVSEQFTAGFAILWERPFMLGERIKVGEYEGEVERVGLRATTLRSEDRVAIHVPNSYLISHAIFNRSKTEGGMGITIPVEVAMDTDSGDVISALRKAAERNNRVRSSPSPKAFMTGFTAGGLTFELRAWVNNYADASWAQNELCRAIQSEFQRAGLRFAGSGVAKNTVTPGTVTPSTEDRRPRTRMESPPRNEDGPRTEARSTETRPPRRRSEPQESKPERASRRSTRESTRKPRETAASKLAEGDSSSLELPLAAAPVLDVAARPEVEVEDTLIETPSEVAEFAGVEVTEAPEGEVYEAPPTQDVETPPAEDTDARAPEISPDMPQQDFEAEGRDEPVAEEEPEPVTSAVEVSATADGPDEETAPPRRKTYGRSRRKNPRK